MLCNHNVLPFLSYVFTFDEKDSASVLRSKDMNGICFMSRKHESENASYTKGPFTPNVGVNAATTLQ